ncbi:UDP-2,4-diacetamido-2,4,6-trideoxy-beta-L-altropyranose hydrolase [Lentilitoribacter sp. EG35]|uniref:UDP-2,4-diacetamido-2,4, 6-trideoxy-beta-L-altropyranose hydrolase n=1 Tax=Lentilitoribacter sp. EG35 TaxID=3234192 RepID=UPI003460AC29
MTQKTALFRADASQTMGSGHIMRCLTLANALKEVNYKCEFACRQIPKELIKLIEDSSHNITILPEVNSDSSNEIANLVHSHWLECTQSLDAEHCIALSPKPRKWSMVIVDHYALDRQWERKIAPYCKRILAIDDLADRHHHCDFLLDQNLGRDPNDYLNIVPLNCIKMVGPSYALLRPEFAEIRHTSLARHRSADLNNIIISIGGTDENNITFQILKQLLISPSLGNASITIIMGSQTSLIETIIAEAELSNREITVLTNVSNMAELIAASDLAIGAAGGTAWERCCLGVPSLIIVTAKNQIEGANALNQSGAAIIIEKSATKLPSIETFLKQDNLSEKLSKMSAAASLITDGHGAARVVHKITVNKESNIILRKANAKDKDLLYTWVNDCQVRKNALNTATIPYYNHEQWFSEKLKDTDGCHLLIVENTIGQKIGQIRFDHITGSKWELSYSIALEFRGAGLGEKMLVPAIETLGRLHKNITVQARVKKHNLKSRRIFEKLNFNLSSSSQIEYDVYEFHYI